MIHRALEKKMLVALKLKSSHISVISSQYLYQRKKKNPTKKKHKQRRRQKNSVSNFMQILMLVCKLNETNGGTVRQPKMTKNFLALVWKHRRAFLANKMGGTFFPPMTMYFLMVNAQGTKKTCADFFFFLISGFKWKWYDHLQGPFFFFLTLL